MRGEAKLLKISELAFFVVLCLSSGLLCKVLGLVSDMWERDTEYKSRKSWKMEDKFEIQYL